jgi:hypothetical protein
MQKAQPQRVEEVRRLKSCPQGLQM